MLGDITSSFARGARTGLAVTSLALVASLAVGLTTLFASSDVASSPQTVSAASEAAALLRHPAVAGAFASPVTDARPVQGLPPVLDGGAFDTVPPVESPVAVEEPSTAAVPDAPTETPAAPPTAAPAQPAAPPASPAAAAPAEPADNLYARIAAAFPEQPDKAYGVVMCESSGRAALNTGNGYYGLWQFDLPTWQSVGGAGLPSDAPADEQISRARTLYERRGWQPWGCA